LHKEGALMAVINLHIDTKAEKYTQKGPRYIARLHAVDGEIVAVSTEPLFAACRELLKRGISGQIRSYRSGTLCWEGEIEEFARLMVYENDREGPYIAKWHPPAPMTEQVKEKLQRRTQSPNGRSPAAVLPPRVADTPLATKAAGGEAAGYPHGLSLITTTRKSLLDTV
jgi:hypothetical protein